MNPAVKVDCVKRLSRIEGQVCGIAGMVKDDRSCMDIITQISAAAAALRRVEEKILEDYVGRSVNHVTAPGGRRQKIKELMHIMGRVA